MSDSLFTSRPKVVILHEALCDQRRVENLRKSFGNIIVLPSPAIKPDQIIVGVLLDIDFDGSLKSVIRGGVEDSVGDGVEGWLGEP